MWLVMAGRGWGKTRVGAEDMAWYGRTHPDAHMAIIGRTDAGVRRVCIEGPSGMLAVLDRSEVAEYNRSPGNSHLRLTNGALYHIASADSPDALLGLNLARAWCDELAAWRREQTWTQVLVPAMRQEGHRPQIVVTTTPRPVGIVKNLVGQPSTYITRGSTWENADNLPESAMAELRTQYEGTRLGRQELEGELLEDVPGALWTVAQIDALRVTHAPELVRVVVAIDPAGGSQEHNDETGIVVAAKGADGQGYVLADRSCRAQPFDWASRAIGAYGEFSADRIVAEQNFGGLMVEHTIRSVDPNVPVRMVTASRGKRQRAEPVSALYEQGRVHHVGPLASLEHQMTTWVPDSGKSPDRMDALVWALSELFGGDMSFAEYARQIDVTDPPAVGALPWSPQGEEVSLEDEERRMALARFGL